MRQTLLSLLLMVATSVAAMADDFNFLTVSTATIEQSFAINQLRNITFDGDNMIVRTVDGNTESFALVTLNGFTFTSNATAIRNLGTESCNSMQLHSDRIVVNGKGVLKIYNTNGQLVRQTVVNGSTTQLSLDGLPRGIYIARLGTQSLKLAH